MPKGVTLGSRTGRTVPGKKAWLAIADTRAEALALEASLRLGAVPDVGLASWAQAFPDGARGDRVTLRLGQDAIEAEREDWIAPTGGPLEALVCGMAVAMRPRGCDRVFVGALAGLHYENPIRHVVLSITIDPEASPSFGEIRSPWGPV